MVFVQSQKQDPAEIWASIPAWARKTMCDKNARLFALDTVGIAQTVSSRADLQQRMQGIVLLGHFPAHHAVPDGSGAQRGGDLSRASRSRCASISASAASGWCRTTSKAVQRGYHEVIEVPREVMLSTAAADKANAALRVMQAEGGH